jgi:AcrR family transcriptional regulator
MPPLGRPRAQGPSASGLGTEEDILVAASRLFCEVGFAGASTHAIARAAGISQAAMYHYFPSKHAVLLVLLLRTVRPSVEFAAAVRDLEEPATARLWALCAYDVDLLTGGRDNTGSLYLLPELVDDRFAEFHAERSALLSTYRALVEAAAPGAGARAELVFGLVESVILRRRTEPDLAASPVAREVADAALRLLGLTDAEVRAAAAVGTRLLPPTRVGSL